MGLVSYLDQFADCAWSCCYCFWWSSYWPDVQMKFLKNSSPDQILFLGVIFFGCLLIASPTVLIPLGRIIEVHYENQLYQNDRKEYKSCLEKVDPNYIREYCGDYPRRPL